MSSAQRDRSEGPPQAGSTGTITALQASRGVWDAVVVGAGPAGSMAARHLGREGLSVLLVDRQSFPRWKVCGACLNADSVKALREDGLGTMLRDLGAVRLSGIRISAFSRHACLQLPESFSVSRGALDTALVSAAVDAGVAFLPGASATLGPCRRVDGGHIRYSPSGHSGEARGVRLLLAGGQATVAGKVVVAADGLGGNLLSSAGDLEAGWQAPAARVGAGATSSTSPDFYSSGTIFMGIAAGGYVGLVRLEDESLNIAAAFDREHLRQSGGAGEAAAAVLEQAGLPAVEAIESLAWKGTVPLTRGPAARAAERVFAIGDAAGFVEPFTGEGISWALESASAVSRFVLSAVKCWDSSLMTEWEECYRDTVLRSQRTCALLANLLRRRILVRSVVGLLELQPAFARPLVHRVVRPRRSSNARGQPREMTS